MSRQPNGGFIGKENITDNTHASGIYTLSDVARKVADNEFPLSRFTPSRSLRFEAGSSKHLSRTPAVTGNRKTWTWSGWIKRSTGFTTLFSMGSNDSGSTDVGTFLRFESDIIGIEEAHAGVSSFRLSTTQVLRDFAAWYHIVVAFDTTQAVAANRIKLFVNGSQVTSFTTANYPSLNFDTSANVAGFPQRIGAIDVDLAPSQYYSGYLTEVNFIDGQSLDAYSFGEYDARTGEWKPKRYTGTYGTNGYYLPFNDNSSLNNLGLDKSALSVELITNGSFPTDVSGWTLSSGVSGSPSITWVSGAARLANSQNNGVTYHQAISTTIGTTYYVRGFVSNISIGGSSRTCSISKADNTANNSNQVVIGSVAQSSGSGWISGTFVATATTTYIHLSADILGTGTQGADFDMISVAEGGYKNNWNLHNFSITAGVNNDSLVDVPGVGAQVSNDTGGVTRGNYCTLNPLQASSEVTLSSGNLNASGTAGSPTVAATMGFPQSGKYYFEFVPTTMPTSTTHHIGIQNTNLISYTDENRILLRADGNVYNAVGLVRTINGFTTNDVIGLAVDIDNNTLQFYKNGVVNGAPFNNSNSGNSFENYKPYWLGGASGTNTCYFNFGQRAFAYTPPEGFKSLCTTNLPEPSIKRPQDNFDIKLYTGNGSGQTIGNTSRKTDNMLVSRSARFNSTDTAYLTRTPTANGSAVVGTWSGWIKPTWNTSTLSEAQVLFAAGISVGFQATFYIDTSKRLAVYTADNTIVRANVTTSLELPDNVWSHIVIVYQDGVGMLSSDRVRIYLNGVRLTSFASTPTFPPGNAGFVMNNTSYPMAIGRSSFTGANYFNGYMSNLDYVDGQALEPTSFGAFDVDGSWQPKSYSGTYGTNGYKLTFAQEASQTVAVDYLVIAGGAGAGSGGGGAGGYRTSAGTSGGGASAETTLTLARNSAYKITVGAGSSGVYGFTGGTASRGSNSVFATIVSYGGGGGADAYTHGGNGGSGGGAFNTGVGNFGTIGQGYRGGSSWTNNVYSAGGGGGGAGAAAANAVGTSTPGGNGVSSSITGTAVTRAGGGGGGGDTRGTAAGIGGTGGGGSGSTTNGGSGTANTGGGGGGGGYSGSWGTGGNGGSGVVIIKVPNTVTTTFSAGVTSSLSTAVAGFNIYTITATSTTSETVTFA